jgi:hypothetical protein
MCLKINGDTLGSLRLWMVRGGRHHAGQGRRSYLTIDRRIPRQRWTVKLRRMIWKKKGGTAIAVPPDPPGALEG